MSALDTPKGVITEVTGDQIGRRQLAIAALHTARRDLQPDVPEMVNIVIRAVPGTENQIAIIKLDSIVE